MIDEEDDFITQTQTKLKLGQMINKSELKNQKVNLKMLKIMASHHSVHNTFSNPLKVPTA